MTRVKRGSGPHCRPICLNMRGTGLEEQDHSGGLMVVEPKAGKDTKSSP